MTAAARFQAWYGEPPVGVWAAPGRVNLIGEHTDYNDGYVLPFALPHRTAVAAGLAEPAGGPQRGAGGRQWTVWSAQSRGAASFGEADLVPGAVTGWPAYVAGVVWALREAGYQVPGARLAVDSRVPVGAGLSSSAALQCAVLAALADLGGLALPVGDRPALARRAEQEFVGVPCGIMDQSAAILARTGQALFLDCRTGAATHVPLDLTAAGLALLVIDTRTPHRLVSGEYAARRTACAQAAAMLGVPALRDLSVTGLPAALATLAAARPTVAEEAAVHGQVGSGRPGAAVDPAQRFETCPACASAPPTPAGLEPPPAPAGAAPTTAGPEAPLAKLVRHVVTENQRVLDTVARLRAGQIATIGPLLSASHASLRDDFEVSVPQLDVAAEAAAAAGAYGARMTGAGFGGCVIALVSAEAADGVAAAVTEAFAARGFARPVMFTATPSAGAARLP
jgi:galactokinase